LFALALRLAGPARGGRAAQPQQGGPTPAPSSAMDAVSRSVEPAWPASRASRLELGRGEVRQEAAQASSEPPAYPAHLFDPRRFEGSGALQGRLRTPEGAAAPARWTLILEPSKVLLGGERARARRVDFEAGELEFELRDVPLGGYAVRAEAAGFHGPVEQVLLARPDSLRVVLELALTRPGTLEGRLVDAHGAGVGGVGLWLAPLSDGPSRRATASQPDGRFRIDGLADGEYRLHAGAQALALRDPIEVAFQAPHLQLEDWVLPELGSLDLRVLDPGGRGVAGATIEATCERRGSVVATCDALGQALLEHLPSGQVQLVVSPPEGTPGRPKLVSARIHAPGELAEPLEVVLER
jgi:hypothetical protein